MSAWPTGTVPTTNVDAATDDPSAARSDIETCFGKVNDMIGARAQASGVASLDGTGVVPAGELAKALLLAGGTLTGFLILHADPTSALHAATKQYVDAQVAAAEPFATGVKMLFRNLTVSGWTKDTSFNEHSIRVVTGGSLSAGGATDLTTVFGSGKVSGSTTLTAAQSGVPAHTHTTDSQGNHAHSQDGSTQLNSGSGSSGHQNVAAFAGGGTTAAAGAHTHTAQANATASASSGHTHTLSMDLKYMDMHLFTKD